MIACQGCGRTGDTYARLQVGTELRQAMASLEKAKADNLALVERLRYVQGYRAQARSKGTQLAGSLQRRIFPLHWQPPCDFSQAVAMRYVGIDCGDRLCYRAHTGKLSMPGHAQGSEGVQG